VTKSAIRPGSNFNRQGGSIFHQRQHIETDYGMREGRLVIETRGALVQYVLQRYQIDPTKVHAKATAQQIVVANLDELQPWLYH
ncbi:hypothetical protein LES12_25605, partial [Pseudomonas aeruginosa]